MKGLMQGKIMLSIKFKHYFACLEFIRQFLNMFWFVVIWRTKEKDLL